MANNDQSRRGFLELILGSAAVATIGAVIFPVVKYIVLYITVLLTAISGIIYLKQNKDILVSE